MKKPLVFFFLIPLSITGLNSPTHATFGEQIQSVHFHSGMADFAMPPRRAGVLTGEGDDRISRGKEGLRATSDASSSGSDDETVPFELSEEGDANRKREKAAQQQKLGVEANRAVGNGEIEKAINLWREFGEKFGRTGPVKDRLEVLSHGASPSLISYLEAMDLADNLDPSDTKATDRAKQRFAAFANDTNAPDYLREHALYQLGRYEEVLVQFLKGEKREASLIMLARKRENPMMIRKYATQLLTEFPKTRFRASAEGLLAGADYSEKAYTKAADRYITLNDGFSIALCAKQMPKTAKARENYQSLALEMVLIKLDQAKTFTEYNNAILVVKELLEGGFSKSAGEQFHTRMLTRPDVARPYFYYRLYHCNNEPKDLKRLADLAEQVANKQGRASLSPSVQVRLAEVFMANSQPQKALDWASIASNNSVASNTTDETAKDRALYVRGAALMALGKFAMAQQDFQRLLDNCPNSPLRHGTREVLALVSEKKGDLATALDQYLNLHYRPDYAYLIDAKMSISTLIAYYDNRPRLIQRPLIAYSIALRQMRKGNYAAAHDWLNKIPAKEYQAFQKGIEGYEDNTTPDPQKTLAKIEAFEERASKINSTQNNLNSNQWAAVRYEYATWLYKNSDLLFYNKPLWKYSREWNFSFHWNSDVATLGDKKAIEEHMNDHEVYVHALAVCQEIAERAPGSPTAPKALYRGACCCDHLANFNGMWRSSDWQGTGKTKETGATMLRLGAALMTKVYTHYPKDPLAKSARKYAGVYAGTAAKNNLE